MSKQHSQKTKVFKFNNSKQSHNNVVVLLSLFLPSKIFLYYSSFSSFIIADCDFVSLSGITIKQTKRKRLTNFTYA